jgi:hypothetical protein
LTPLFRPLQEARRRTAHACLALASYVLRSCLTRQKLHAVSILNTNCGNDHDRKSLIFINHLETIIYNSIEKCPRNPICPILDGSRLCSLLYWLFQRPGGYEIPSSKRKRTSRFPACRVYSRPRWTDFALAIAVSRAGLCRSRFTPAGTCRVLAVIEQAHSRRSRIASGSPPASARPDGSVVHQLHP